MKGPESRDLPAPSAAHFEQPTYSNQQSPTRRSPTCLNLTPLTFTTEIRQTGLHYPPPPNLKTSNSQSCLTSAELSRAQKFHSSTYFPKPTLLLARWNIKIHIPGLRQPGNQLPTKRYSRPQKCISKNKYVNCTTLTAHIFALQSRTFSFRLHIVMPCYSDKQSYPFFFAAPHIQD